MNCFSQVILAFGFGNSIQLLPGNWCPRFTINKYNNLYPTAEAKCQVFSYLMFCTVYFYERRPNNRHDNGRI